MTELVSVIVPTKNSARTLNTCLESVRAQENVNLELIVVDNHSNDDTESIAKAHADYFERCGPERSAQRNRGAAVANGNYLFFVDADMVLKPSLVRECLTIIEATGANGVIVPEISIGAGFWSRCRALERSCYAGDDSIEAARFFPRRSFEAVGGYDEQLVGGEDWDLSLRVGNSKRYPRSAGVITHDEGRIRLRPWLAKKCYYGRSFRRYSLKHPRSAIVKANLVARPAILRNWRRLWEHPFLGLGVLLLKVLESGAAAAGMLTASSASRGDSGRG